MPPMSGERALQAYGGDFLPNTSRQDASASAAPVGAVQRTDDNALTMPCQHQEGSQHAVPTSPLADIFTASPADAHRKRPGSGLQSAAIRRRLDFPPLRNLNELQRKAAYSPIDKPSLIVAGAGTGKSTVMVVRAQHGVQQGADQITASTFHGYSYRLVNQYQHLLGFKGPLTIWGDAKDIRAIVKEAIRKASLDAARQQALKWLPGSWGLTPKSTWEDILKAVHTHDSGMYNRCKVEADRAMQNEKKKQDAKQQRISFSKAEGGAQTAGKGVDSKAALRAALHRASLMERCMLVYDELCLLHTGTRQPPKMRAGDVPAKKAVTDMKRWISMCKSHGHVVSMYEGPGRAFGMIWRAYQDILLSCNAVDFDDLLAMAVQLLSTHDYVLASERARYKMMLVDEFQDCNPAQIALVELLQKGRGFVTAVGDNMQSIYGFRGADHRCFQLFEEAFAPQAGPDCMRPLLNNYRSTPEIIAVANAAAAGTQCFPHKVLVASKPSCNNPVQLLSYSHSEHAAQQIVREMKALNAKEMPYENMAVLMYSVKNDRADRTEALTTELRRKAIKHQVMKEKPFFAREPVKDAMAHLKLVMNPHDDIAFERLLPKPPKTLSKEFLAKLKKEQFALAEQQQNRAHVSLSNAAVSLRNAPGPPSVQWTKLKEYLRFLDKARDQCLSMTPSQALSYLVKKSGYLAWLQKRNDKQAKGKQQRQHAKVTQRQPGDSDESSGDDEDDYGDGVSSDEEEEQGPGSTAVDQELQRADKRLHQLYCMAVRFEKEWRNPQVVADDAPAEPGPASLQSSDAASVTEPSMEVASMPALAEQALQGLPDDPQQPTCVEQRPVGPEPLLDFLSHCALDTPDPCDAKSKQQQGVYIGTVHSAKGLEWDAVWVRAHQGFCELPPPYQRPKDEPPSPIAAHPYLRNASEEIVADQEEHEAEGQRLVYVALTRAKQHMYIYTQRNEKALCSDFWTPDHVDNHPPDFVRKIKARASTSCEVKVVQTRRESALGMPADWQHV
ncbi:hypothetical protein WJX73_001259 [Symbiochloris irregularis]|uniref:DNA 3'-5' helicase n=1 Tax=Symbiochloris irregularis TaxID=706552 RepID=A0AAW1NRY7_9CHLO